MREVATEQALDALPETGEIPEGAVVRVRKDGTEVRRPTRMTRLNVDIVRQIWNSLDRRNNLARLRHKRDPAKWPSPYYLDQLPDALYIGLLRVTVPRDVQLHAEMTIEQRLRELHEQGATAAALAVSGGV